MFHITPCTEAKHKTLKRSDDDGSDGTSAGTTATNQNKKAFSLTVFLHGGVMGSNENCILRDAFFMLCTTSTSIFRIALAMRCDVNKSKPSHYITYNTLHSFLPDNW